MGPPGPRPEAAATHVPRATYRLQLRREFGFARAAELLDYLGALGVSHVYTSPVLQATPGSPHGYDVVDPTRVSDELGGEAGLRELLGALDRNGMGWILDVVPNHMALGPHNPFWADLLENGPSSPFAPWFDVDWEAPEERLRGKVLVPVLGDHYGRVLEAGELRLEREGGRLRVRYHDHLLPLSPGSVGWLLEEAGERARGDRRGRGESEGAGEEAGGAGEAGPPAGSGPRDAAEPRGPGAPEGRSEAPRSGAGAGSADELAFLGRALQALPEASDRGGRARRHRDLEVALDRLTRLLEADPSSRDALDRVVAEVGGDPDTLDRILERQHWRLAYWRAGTRELDYRRFFDVDTLVGIRVEEREVFEETHRRILDWLEGEGLDGVRVDHPDGLRRPGAYLERLRRHASDMWLVVEKIVEPGESLRSTWPVDGTTGYDALNEVTGLFVDPAAEGPFTELWDRFTGRPTEWEAVAAESRRQVLREVLAADVARLAHLFVAVCEQRRRYRDFTRWELRRTLEEVAASFPVYRSYVDEDGSREEEDRVVVEEAVERARVASPDLDGELFDLLRAVLLGEANAPPERELRMRFQQLTGPAMAKGVEDTALYVYGRFVALNEVGGDPSRFGLPPAAFHEACRRRQERFPTTMTALSTHDNKRSEDVRARLAVLSEMPELWGEAVCRWAERTTRHRDGPERPDRATEYLFYQTVVGAWPLEVDRAVAYMRKAVREARTHTSWTDPDEAWEGSLLRFVEAALEDAAFRSEVEALVGRIAGPAAVTSLAAKLTQLTMPGVPDLYQGTELLDLSLVDPDNRRPVDYGTRRRLLDALAGSLRAADPGTGEGGSGAAWGFVRAMRPPEDPDESKLWVVHRALDLRRRRPEAFGPAGTYEPRQAKGPAADHVVAFLRGGGALTVVPRLTLRLREAGGWRGTVLALPEGRWRNVLTGEPWAGEVPVERLLEAFPVALLQREEER